MDEELNKKFDMDESIFRNPELEKALQEYEKANAVNSFDEEANITPPDFKDDETESIPPSGENGENNLAENPQDFEKPDQETSETENKQADRWEETDDDNSVVKKYIVYISRDYVPYIDELSLDERSAFINDALEIKIASQNAKKQMEYKKKLVMHFIVAFTVVVVSFPFALLGVHKAIMATFENYKYSQDNFEKLYKHKFEKNKAYVRSVQYNKTLENKRKQ